MSKDGEREAIALSNTLFKLQSRSSHEGGIA